MFTSDTSQILSDGESGGGESGGGELEGSMCTQSPPSLCHMDLTES